MRRARVAAVAFGVLAIAAAAYVVASSRDSSTAVDPLDTARKAAKEQRGQRQVDPGLRPAPGTYVYRGAGTESVSVLGGVKHSFPAKIAAVVTLHGKGCEWSLETTYLEEHTAMRSFCTDELGTHELGATESVRFLSIEQVDKYDCARGLVAPATARGRTRLGGWRFTCTADDRTVRHELHVGITPRVFELDGHSIGVPEVTDVHHVSGASQGTITSTTWYAQTGLPLSYTSTGMLRSESPLGDIDYVTNEHWELESLRPIMHEDV